MDTEQKPEIRYISSSIVRADPYQFVLQYRVGKHVLSLNGLESRHESGGSIDFPSSEIWGRALIEKFGERDVVKSNIIDYAKQSQSLSFISEHLLLNGQPSIHAPSSKPRRYKRFQLHPLLKLVLIAVAVFSALLIAGLALRYAA